MLGLATHLLGGDLGFVAWQRDEHRGTPAPGGLDERGFINRLDDLQVEWVHAARRLSPRLVVELLEWMGDQVAETVRRQEEEDRRKDPSSPTANVSWASADPVPVWLDHARELSERWIHRQQILQALEHPSDLRPDLAEPVLDGLRWAYPHRLTSVRRPTGTTVAIAVTGPEIELRWSLVSNGDCWRFGPGAESSPVAELRMTTEQAWRSLTSNLDSRLHGELQATGDREITDTLRHTRAIIGTTK